MLRGVNSNYRYGPWPSDHPLRSPWQSVSTLSLYVCFAVGILFATSTAYAVGLFQVTGGVIILPADATLIGLIAAVGIGSRRGGLAFAWLAHFAAYTGFRADWAFLGLTGHSLAGKLAFLFDPVGLTVLAVATLIIGTVGFTIGYLAQWSVNRLKDDPLTTSQQ